MMERVSDYPRPPRLEHCSDHVRVEALGRLLAESNRSIRILETFHPPTYYLPPDAFNLDLLESSSHSTFCEWKGIATYHDVVFGDQRLHEALWTYLNPSDRFREIAGWYALYPALMDACWVNAELVIPQPGSFYGGWITPEIQGPFKGDPQHPKLI
ncbi:hypothetical protein OMCYN_01775 [cyanobiont of Ornithocercus magnificus]|nr:hypothetical protein OMCYN_01775 [cyanobiont of Ornithocercus magnificus]